MATEWCWDKGYFSKCILPCSEHASWSTGGSEYESKSKYAKRSTEGTFGMRTPFVKIFKHASIQDSKESIHRNMTQPRKKQHLLKSIVVINLDDSRENELNLRIKCCTFTSHMLPDYNILSWYMKKYILCSFWHVYLPTIPTVVWIDRMSIVSQ